MMTDDLDDSIANKKSPFIWKLLKVSGFLTLLGTTLGFMLFVALYLYIVPNLPSIESLKEVQFQQPLRVYTSDGKLIAEYGEKRRIPLNIEEIPITLKNAFIAAEDDRYWEHPGVDYQGLIRAALNVAMTGGSKSQGGSTITMQVARNFFLTREKTYLRKINEIFLAMRIEKQLSKDQILELYLNKIYLGKRAYGVGSAAQIYYGKTVDELTLAESAMIAGLPKAPSSYNPIINPGRAIERRNYVLGRMLSSRVISEIEYQLAVNNEITASIFEVPVEIEAPYVGEMARAFAVDRYGEDAAYSLGLNIYTTIDSRLQKAANLALRNGLLDYEKRHGYRGPIRRLEDTKGLEKLKVSVVPADSEENSGNEISDASNEKAENSDAFVVLTPEEEVALGELQKRLDEELSNIVSLPNLLPGIITVVDEQSASVYLGAGQIQLIPWQGLEWAGEYVSADVIGELPEKAEQVVTPGDVVWLRFTKNDISKEKAKDDAGAEIKSEGYYCLSQKPEVEGALVSLKPDNGAIQALVGGYDFFSSKFNRAVQAERQPGSNFKPFIYAAALDNGYTPASIFNDAPVVFIDPALEDKWKPENYSGKFFGPTRLRQGLVQSRNLVSIRLLRSLGVGKARSYARRFGFSDAALPRDLSLILGSGILTPLQLVTGFTVFANNGFLVEPFVIDRVLNSEEKEIYLAAYNYVCEECLEQEQQEMDEESLTIALANSDNQDADIPNDALQVDGSADTPEPTVDNEEATDVDDGKSSSEVQKELASHLGADNNSNKVQNAGWVKIERLKKPAERVIDPRVTYLINTMLQDVIRQGTGRRALQLGRLDLAGKTGTTNDFIDAWFSGYNQHLVTTSWVGYDTRKSLGNNEAGARAALPIWIDYMRVALDGLPEEPRDQPKGLTTIRIDAETGLLANSFTPNAIFETFRDENVPTEETTASTQVLEYQRTPDTVEPVEEEIF